MMTFEEIERRLAEYDKEAGIFINQIIRLSSLWDHLIDKDKPVTDAEINHAFETMLIWLPRNNFYMRNFKDLNPILVMSIKNWHIANEIERDEDHTDFDLDISFIIRSSYVDLVTMTALLAGGDKFAAEIGIAARKYVHREGRVEYAEELCKEKSRRRRCNVRRRRR